MQELYDGRVGGMWRDKYSSMVQWLKKEEKKLWSPIFLSCDTNLHYATNNSAILKKKNLILSLTNV